LPVEERTRLALADAAGLDFDFGAAARAFGGATGLITEGTTTGFALAGVGTTVAVGGTDGFAAGLIAVLNSVVARPGGTFGVLATAGLASGAGTELLLAGDATGNFTGGTAGFGFEAGVFTGAGLAGLANAGLGFSTLAGFGGTTGLTVGRNVCLAGATDFTCAAATGFGAETGATSILAGVLAGTVALGATAAFATERVAGVDATGSAAFPAAGLGWTGILADAVAATGGFACVAGRAAALATGLADRATATRSGREEPALTAFEGFSALIDARGGGKAGDPAHQQARA
jgi:hypothetical protein